LEQGGFDINAVDGLGNSALLNAAQYGHFEILQMLLEVPGININLQNRQWNTALHLAASRDDESSVKLLIEKGAKFTLKNKQKQLPINVTSSAEVKKLLQMAEFATKLDDDVASDDDGEEGADGAEDD